MSGLRDALAEALHTRDLIDVCFHGTGMGAPPKCEQEADAILAHPAMVAALRATDVPSHPDFRKCLCVSEQEHRRATDVPSDRVDRFGRPRIGPRRPEEDIVDVPDDAIWRDLPTTDPIETFSHPFVGPVVIDGHLLTHTSDCKWPRAELGRLKCSSLGDGEEEVS